MDAQKRKWLRELLRISRFNAWSVDKLEDEIVKLFRGEVDIHPPDPATQRLGPP
jgi:hypothetical protein